MCGIAGVAAICGSPPALAQRPDPSRIEAPNLQFTPNEDTIGEYYLHYYFHRDDTDFATAYADLRECDALASNISYNLLRGLPDTPFPFIHMGGGALGAALSPGFTDAIYASGERRRIRRVNMRTCMGYKGYQAYGLPSSIWRRFNFEEGTRSVPAARRQQLLQIQARVASGPKPTIGEIR